MAKNAPSSFRPMLLILWRFGFVWGLINAVVAAAAALFIVLLELWEFILKLILILVFVSSKGWSIIFRNMILSTRWLETFHSWVWNKSLTILVMIFIAISLLHRSLLSVFIVATVSIVLEIRISVIYSSVSWHVVTRLLSLFGFMEFHSLASFTIFMHTSLWVVVLLIVHRLIITASIFVEVTLAALSTTALTAATARLLLIVRNERLSTSFIIKANVFGKSIPDIFILLVTTWGASVHTLAEIMEFRTVTAL